MKKVYILILISFCSFLTKAQYTITAASNPIPGDIENFIDLDSTGLFLGSSGTSQIWNYSSIISLGNPTNTGTYVPMSSVPNNTMFPGATVAVQYGTAYGILSCNSTKFEYLGYAEAILANCWAYSDPYKVYSLPFTFGSISTDTYVLFQPTNITRGTFTTTGDGTGTLQLPSATYTNVLKLSYAIFETDTASSGPVSNYTITMNQYYSTVSKFLLLEVQTAYWTVTSGTNTSFYYNKYGRVADFGILSTGITNKESESGLNVFPNPVSTGEFFISNADPSCGKMTVEINNVLGQRVKTISFENQSGTEPKKINVSDLAKGIYYLKITGKEVIKIQKIIIE